MNYFKAQVLNTSKWVAGFYCQFREKDPDKVFDIIISPIGAKEGNSFYLIDPKTVKPIFKNGKEKKEEVIRLYRAKKVNSSEWVVGFYYQLKNDNGKIVHYIVSSSETRSYEIDNKTLKRYEEKI